jgi:hypothetical protein
MHSFALVYQQQWQQKKMVGRSEPPVAMCRGPDDFLLSLKNTRPIYIYILYEQAVWRYNNRY